tara:strand:- start:169 stop:549 length:381 start_codon:yes stop_codon:yes gene_type:complete
VKNEKDYSNVIDLMEILSNSLGLPYPVVKEASPLVFEFALRFHEVVGDVIEHHQPQRDTYALAQAMAGAMLIETASDLLQVDPDDLLCRLIEAGHRGLFDMDESEASSHLQSLFNRYEKYKEDNLV